MKEMTIYIIYAMIVNVTCVLSGTYLIINDHGWWSLFPFFMTLTVTLVKTKEKTNEKKDNN